MATGPVLSDDIKKATSELLKACSEAARARVEQSEAIRRRVDSNTMFDVARSRRQADALAASKLEMLIGEIAKSATEVNSQDPASEPGE